MSRHCSPTGRNAHQGPPLLAVTAAAGAGAHRSSLLPQGPLPAGLRARIVATVVAGGALAATGQAASTGALPDPADGANVLRLGIEQLIGPATARVGPPTAVTGVDPARLAEPPVVTAAGAPAEPVDVDAQGLLKAAELHRRALEAARAAEAARAGEAAKIRAPDRTGTGEARTGEARTREPQPGARSGDRGGVRIVTGRVSSGFGSRGGAMHWGLDIAAPIGAAIRVPLEGTVISSGPASGFGLWVRVRHDDGTVTVYGHINRSLVRVGQRVAAGQEIAEVGNRGQSTGPHLHIEVVTPSGEKVDPRPWLDTHRFGY